MATCIFYIDESGNKATFNTPLLSGQTPIFVLTGVSLPLENWRAFDREYLSLKNKFFKPELNRNRVRAERWEIKGNLLTQPRNKNNRRYHNYINELLNSVSRYDGKLLSCITIKDPIQPINQTSLYTKSLQILVERFNYYIQESDHFNSGIMVVDASSTGFDKQVAWSHMSYIFGHETGKELKNIAEAPLFADSRLSSGLQLVDNLSSIVYSIMYQRNASTIPGAKNYSHMTKYYSALKTLEFKSKNKYEGHFKNGFRVVNHND